MIYDAADILEVFVNANMTLLVFISLTSFGVCASFKKKLRLVCYHCGTNLT